MTLAVHADDLVGLLQRAAAPCAPAVAEPLARGVALPTPLAHSPAMLRSVPLPTASTRAWTPADEAKVKRDRKGRFAEKNAADVLSELDGLVGKLKGLAKHISSDERDVLDNALEYLKELRGTRHDLAANGKEFAEVHTQQYAQAVEFNVDRSDGTISVDFGDDGNGAFYVTAQDAEDIAEAIDELAAMKLPDKTGNFFDENVFAERTTSSGTFKVVLWDHGMLEIGEADSTPSPDEDGGGNLLIDPADPDDAIGISDALEELAETAARLATAVSGGERAGMTKEKFAELVAQNKVKRGPGGKFAKKASSVVEKASLDETLETLRNAASKDRDKVTAAIGKLKRPELAEIASKLATVKKPTKRTTRTQLIDGILEGTVGFRERAEAIGGWGIPGDAVGLRDDTTKAKAPAPKVTGPKARIDEITEQLKAVEDRGERKKLQDERRQLRNELTGTKPSPRPQVSKPVGDLRTLRGRLEEEQSSLEAQFGDNPDKWPDGRQNHQVAEYYELKQRIRDLEEQDTKPALAAAAPAATRRVSGNPRKPNTWGGAHGADDVHYHPDGAIGLAVRDLGSDAQVEVRGDSLVNVLDRIATDTVAGRMGAQEQADELKKLAGELPVGPGKRAVASAAEYLDVPRIDIDGAWAKGAEPALARFPVLRDLAHKLEAVPLARGATIPGGPGDTRELDKLHTALEQFSRGKLGGLRFLGAIKDLRDGRHESREGRFEIDRVVSDAVRELERMQKADRQSLYPNAEGGGAGPKADGGGGADGLALADAGLVVQRLQRLRGNRPADDTPLYRSQLRQAKIDLARDRANVLAEIEEIVSINEDDNTASVARRFDDYTRQRGLGGDPRIAPLANAIRTGDPDLVRKTLAQVAELSGLDRIGGDLALGPEQLLSFDKGRYEAAGGQRIRPGQKVLLVRPGYQAVVDGELLLVQKAVVQAATPAEIRRIQAGRRANASRFRRAAEYGKEVKAAGLAVVAADTGRVLMLQRALVDDDPAGGMWEMPGGKLDSGEDPLTAAVREWQEETGCELPSGEVVGKWHNGVYCGYVFVVAEESLVPLFDGRDDVTNPDDPDQDQVEALAWWDRRQLTRDNPALRAELRQSLHKMLAALDGLAPVEAEREEYLLERGLVRHPAKPPHEQWMHAGKKKLAKVLQPGLPPALDWLTDDGGDALDVPQADSGDAMPAAWSWAAPKVQASPTPAAAEVVAPRLSVGELLASSSRSERDAAARAVFEGEFARMRTSVRSVMPNAYGVTVDGVILDSDGDEVGEFMRTVARDEGKLVAFHDNLELERHVQGQGFADAFNGHLIDWYRAGGVDRVEWRANSDVGGYAWAAIGDWKNAYAPEPIVRNLATFAELGSEMIPADRLAEQQQLARDMVRRFQSTRFDDLDYPTPLEVRKLGRWSGAGKDDWWIGKRALWGSTWDAVMPL